MQYLLTEEEFNALKNGAAIAAKAQKAVLQDLCSKVADHMATEKPYGWKEGDKLMPYGCILTTRNEYCDTCPVKKICPNEWKEYSK